MIKQGDDKSESEIGAWDTLRMPIGDESDSCRLSKWRVVRRMFMRLISWLHIHLMSFSCIGRGLYSRAVMYRKYGDSFSAWNEVVRVIRRNPEMPEAHLLYSEILEEFGSVYHACYEYLLYVKLKKDASVYDSFPEWVESYKSVLLSSRFLKEQTQELLSTGASMVPDSVKIQIKRASFFLSDHNWAQARALLQNLPEMKLSVDMAESGNGEKRTFYSNLLEGYVQMCQICHAQGCYEDEKEWADFILEHNPECESALLYRAWLYWHDEEYEPGRVLIQRVLKLDLSHESHLSALRTYGEMCVCMSREEDAIQALTEVYELDRDNLEFLFTLGAAYTHFSRYNEAYTYYSNEINRLKEKILLLPEIHRPDWSVTFQEVCDRLEAKFEKDLVAALAELTEGDVSCVWKTSRSKSKKELAEGESWNYGTYWNIGTCQHRRYGESESDNGIRSGKEVETRNRYHDGEGEKFVWFLARLYKERASVSVAIHGVTEDSCRDYLRSLYLEPESSDEWFSLGRCYKIIQHLERAEKSICNAIKLTEKEGVCKRGDSELTGNDARITSGFQLFFRGEIRMEQERYSQALEDFIEACQRLDSIPSSFYGILGRCYVKNRNLTEAQEVYHAGLLAYPESDDLWLQLGRVQLIQGKNEEAYTSFQKAVHHAPDNALNRDTYAMMLAMQGNYDQAHEQLEIAIRLAPDVPDFYVHRSSVHMAQQYYELAILDLTQALKLSPENALFWHLRGHGKYLLDLNEQAVMDFQESLKYEPNSADTYFSLGCAYMDMEQLDSACQSFSHALSLRPGFEAVLRRRAGIYLTQKRYLDALQDLTELVDFWKEAAVNTVVDTVIGSPSTDNITECDEKHPDPHTARDIYLSILCDRAMLQLKMGNIREAHEDVHEVLFWNYDFIPALILAGSILCQEERFYSAVCLLTHVLELEPGNSAAYFLRAQAFSMLDEEECAVNDFQRAAFLQPEKSEYQLAYAEELFSRGNISDAEYYYKRVAKLTPESPDLYFSWGVSYIRRYFFLGGVKYLLKAYRLARRQKRTDLLPRILHYLLMVRFLEKHKKKNKFLNYSILNKKYKKPRDFSIKVLMKRVAHLRNGDIIFPDNLSAACESSDPEMGGEEKKPSQHQRRKRSTRKRFLSVFQWRAVRILGSVENVEDRQAQECLLRFILKRIPELLSGQRMIPEVWDMVAKDPRIIKIMRKVLSLYPEDEAGLENDAFSWESIITMKRWLITCAPHGAFPDKQWKFDYIPEIMDIKCRVTLEKFFRKNLDEMQEFEIITELEELLKYVPSDPSFLEELLEDLDDKSGDDDSEAFFPEDVVKRSDNTSQPQEEGDEVNGRQSGDYTSDSDVRFMKEMPFPQEPKKGNGDVLDDLDNVHEKNWLDEFIESSDCEYDGMEDLTPYKTDEDDDVQEEHYDYGNSYDPQNDESHNFTQEYDVGHHFHQADYDELDESDLDEVDRSFRLNEKTGFIQIPKKRIPPEVPDVRYVPDVCAHGYVKRVLINELTGKRILKIMNKECFLNNQRKAHENTRAGSVDFWDVYNAPEYVTGSDGALHEFAPASRVCEGLKRLFMRPGQLELEMFERECYGDPSEVSNTSEQKKRFPEDDLGQMMIDFT